MLSYSTISKKLFLLGIGGCLAFAGTAAPSWVRADDQDPNPPAGQPAPINEEDALVLQLGDYEGSMGEDSLTDYELVSLKVTGLADTQTETLFAHGCYQAKEATGQSFPYAYHYTPFQSTAELLVSIEGRTIKIFHLEKRLEELRDAVKTKIPWYCTIKRSLGIEVTLRAEDGTEKNGIAMLWRARLGSDYTDTFDQVVKPNGKPYTINLLPAGN